MRLFCLSCQTIFNHGLRYEGHFKTSPDCAKIDLDNYLPQLFLYYVALLESCKDKSYQNCNFASYKHHQFYSSIYPISFTNSNFVNFILRIVIRHQNCQAPVQPMHYDIISQKYNDNSLVMSYSSKLFTEDEFQSRIRYNRTFLKGHPIIL